MQSQTTCSTARYTAQQPADANHPRAAGKGRLRLALSPPLSHQLNSKLEARDTIGTSSVTSSAHLQASTREGDVASAEAGARECKEALPPLEGRAIGACEQSEEDVCDEGVALLVAAERCCQF